MNEGLTTDAGCAMVGATVGPDGIPPEWLAGIMEWPRSVGWMRQLSWHLAAAADRGDGALAPAPLPLFWPWVPARNLLFLAVVLAHGFRRLLPPY